MKFTSTAVVVAALFSSSVALAQDAIVEGPGYQVGEGTVLHPFLGAETGYDSNVFFEEDSPVATPLIRILAKFELANIEDSKISGQEAERPTVAFRSGLRLAYEEFLTSNSSARTQRNVGIGADLDMTLRPGSTVPVRFSDHFVRDNRPTNFESDRTLSHDVNQLEAELRYQPNGRTISGALTFQNTLDFFESEDSSFANRMQNKIGAKLDWQFLPVTRFYLDGSIGFFGGLGDSSTKVSSMPVTGKIGAATALTANTTLRTSAGYAAGFYSSGASYSGVLFNFEFGLRYSPVGRVTLGYERNFKDSINANFYGEHLLKLGINQQLGRVLVTGHFSGHLRTYEGITIASDPVRNDLILDGGLQAGYALREWLALTANYQTTIVSTDYRTMIGTEVDDPGYVRHQLMAGATAAF